MIINYKRIFLDSQNRINAFWKIFGLFVLIFILTRVLYFISHKLSIPQNWQNSFAILGTIIFTFIFIKVVDRRPLKEFGFYFKKYTSFVLLLGLICFPLAIYFTYAVIICPLYTLNVQILKDGIFGSAILVSLIQNTIVALNEELIFRAYIITNIKNKVIALIVSTFLFAISHTGFSISSYVYLILFGVFFFFIYVRFGIYLAILIHLLNNWVSGMFYLTPVNLLNQNVFLTETITAVGRIVIFLLLFFLIKNVITRIRETRGKVFA